MKSLVTSAAFSFGYGIGRILFDGFKDVLQGAAVPGSTQYRNNSADMAGARQQEDDQHCSEIGYRLLRSSSVISLGKVNPSKRV